MRKDAKSMNQRPRIKCNMKHIIQLCRRLVSILCFKRKLNYKKHTKKCMALCKTVTLRRTFQRAHQVIRKFGDRVRVLDDLVMIFEGFWLTDYVNKGDPSRGVPRGVSSRTLILGFLETPARATTWHWHMEHLGWVMNFVGMFEEMKSQIASKTTKELLIRQADWKDSKKNLQMKAVIMLRKPDDFDPKKID
ncbi:hypothetical protein Sjap_001362 [Stephania japonica]|uniref:Uncharacterized protein n=1 Tax=Stephania japonica TaxID=461633 RepID=A0AAP0KJU0_9MAGN